VFFLLLVEMQHLSAPAASLSAMSVFDFDQSDLKSKWNQLFVGAKTLNFKTTTTIFETGTIVCLSWLCKHKTECCDFSEVHRNSQR